jgi:mannobiose 2-epimerase
VTVDTRELLRYRQNFDRELRDNILAYWQRHAVETDGDGFFGAVDLDNRPC